MDSEYAWNMSESPEELNRNTVNEFKAELKRLQDERDAKSLEMRMAAYQTLAKKVNQTRKEAGELANSLKQLEDSQQQDRAELRRAEINLAIEYDENTERMALEEANYLDSTIGVLRSVFAKLTTDINSLNRSVSELDGLVALAVKIKKPKLAKDQIAKAKVHMANIMKTVNPIAEKLLQISRSGKIDEQDNERINYLIKIQSKTYGVADEIEKVGELWMKGNGDDQWLDTLDERMKFIKQLSGEVVDVWSNTPKV